MAEYRALNYEMDVLPCIDDARRYIEACFKLRKQEMQKKRVDEYIIDMLDFRKAGGKVSFMPFTDSANHLIGVGAEYSYDNPDYNCDDPDCYASPTLTVSKSYTWEQLGELVTRDMVK